MSRGRLNFIREDRDFGEVSQAKLGLSLTCRRCLRQEVERFATALSFCPDVVLPLKGVISKTGAPARPASCNSGGAGVLTPTGVRCGWLS
jgi:hypothetical protein